MPNINIVTSYHRPAFNHRKPTTTMSFDSSKCLPSYYFSLAIRVFRFSYISVSLSLSLSLCFSLFFSFFPYWYTLNVIV